MDYIKFANGTKLEIEETATLGNIRHLAETEAAALAVCALVTPENLTHVEFSNDEGVYGEYDNLISDAQPTRQATEDGVLVTISLREKTALELRVDALEDSQALQDGAIEDIADVVSELAEG